MKDGEDLNVVLACEDEDKERLARNKYGKNYDLVECECPKDAHIVNEEPRIPGADIYMRELHNFARDYDPFINVRHSAYDTKTCERCKNRYKRSEFCDKHCCDKKCYRFKLES